MIKKLIAKYSIWLILLFVLGISSVIKAVDGKDYITLSTAVFDFIQKGNTSLEGRFEYRLQSANGDLKPFGGLMSNTEGAYHIYSGFYADISLNSFLSFMPSFAPGLYFKGHSKDLYFKMVFRTQIELVVKLQGGIRMGVAFNHISNASFGKLNPGVESIALIYYIPF